MEQIVKPIGGQRLGSENKMNIAMHNYHRSTHNLSTTRKTTMAPGVLYPIYTNIALNGDVWDIDIESAIRTLPTQAPLFGSFKLQVDTFIVPIRLYQGILHNNPINIGMQMNKVLLPKLAITNGMSAEDLDGNLQSQISKTCLLKYLGLSGLGTGAIGSRKFNAVPLLAYYDIFKNYYANKQEDNAYVIGEGILTEDLPTVIHDISANNTSLLKASIGYDNKPSWSTTNPAWSNWDGNTTLRVYINCSSSTVRLQDVGIMLAPSNAPAGADVLYLGNISEIADLYPQFVSNVINTGVQIVLTVKNIANAPLAWKENNYLQFVQLTYEEQTIPKLGLIPFPLANIDKMRNELLSSTQLGTEYIIDDSLYEPYSLNTVSQEQAGDVADFLGNLANLNGLCVKTYQSDIFNNWVKNELVEGANGIAEITAIDTSEGSFSIDALNLAQKVYNMLNRIAASGGTYEDWQEVVYTSNVNRRAETPIYCGGMSSEVAFEEIVSTAASGENPLGTLAGKGKQFGKKGGKVHIKVEEPSVVMIIASLTPRVDYSQGNEWYMTELNSIDDLHKPALDGIGFEDLIGERMAWWDTFVKNDGTLSRSKIGKSVAWINYMTDVDKVYGEFAAGEGQSYMVLNRDYTPYKDSVNIWRVQDFTTYIDPSKFNYAFANANLDAQNFWGAFRFDIKCRRVMSAKQIPNL